MAGLLAFAWRVSPLPDASGLSKLLPIYNWLTGYPSDDSEIGRDALLELKALLDGAVLRAAKPAAVQNRVQNRMLLELKKPG